MPQEGVDEYTCQMVKLCLLNASISLKQRATHTQEKTRVASTDLAQTQPVKRTCTRISISYLFIYWDIVANIAFLVSLIMPSEKLSYLLSYFYSNNDNNRK
jgi:hypothetical protein